jgi:hypothetical protein
MASRGRPPIWILLGCPQGFFKRDAVTIEKSPHRATATRNPSLAHGGDNLIQGSVRLLGIDRKYSICGVAPAW